MIVVVIILLLIILFASASIVPKRSTLSDFELRRRLDNKTDGALLEWRRSEVITEVMTLRRILLALILVIVSAILTSNYGWDWGLLWAFLITLFYNRVAAFAPIKAWSQTLYNRYESSFLTFVEKSKRYIRPLRGVADTQLERTIASREELAHATNELKSLLSVSERKMISGVLDFENKLVRDYMTPRSMMEAIGANELLGPLVLDGLHKTGHSHFPVFSGDIDHIIGMLHIHTLFHLEDRKSQTVKDVMEPQVLYINEEQTLGQALNACIKHRRHLLVVINEFRETVGVITIEDAVEQLIGQQIIDQFAEHDDLRVVAARNPRGNNTAKKSSDV